MSQRTFLGLTHNPFVPPKEGFFSGADRKTHLEHLRHLSQWSRRILVVSGPYGIGKSTLFRELSANLEPHTKAARLAGTVVTSEREVLAALLHGFGIAADTASGADDLSDVISRFVDEQDNNGRACMVMVDDGHLLEPGALQRLVSLVAECALRMVVFAETTVIGAIDRDTKAADLEWFEIRLTGFPKSDVRDYLEWRISQAQYRGLLPFTDEQVESIVTKSSGNPGVIDSLASNLLIEMETGQIRNRGAAFPILHGVLAVLLVAFVGLLYVWFQQDLSTSVDEDSSTTVATLDAVDVESTPSDAMPEASLPAASAESDDADADTDPDNQQGPAGVEVVDNKPDQNTQTEVDENAWIKQEFGQAGLTAPSSPSDTTREPPSATDQSPTGGTTEPQTEVAQSAQSIEPVEQAEAVAVDVEPESAVPVTESAPSSQSVDTTPEASADGIKSARWLLAQDPRRFTVQLVTVSRAERARELILEQADPGEFAVYQINRDGRRLNVITFGVFSNTQAANTAAQDLVGQLATVKPWVRPLNLVQDAVRAGL